MYLLIRTVYIDRSGFVKETWGSSDVAKDSATLFVCRRLWKHVGGAWSGFQHAWALMFSPGSYVPWPSCTTTWTRLPGWMMDDHTTMGWIHIFHVFISPGAKELLRQVNHQPRCHGSRVSACCPVGSMVPTKIQQLATPTINHNIHNYHKTIQNDLIPLFDGSFWEVAEPQLSLLGQGSRWLKPHAGYCGVPAKSLQMSVLDGHSGMGFGWFSCALI